MKRRILSALFALILFAPLPIRARADRLLVPGGQTIALELGDDSVTVAAFDDSLGHTARNAGIHIGDEILEINGRAVHSAGDVKQILSESSGEIRIKVLRSGKERTLSLVPCSTDTGPKLGIYLRQGIAGVGTITFYDPRTGTFGTLGHGVNDAKGSLLPMTRGSAYPARILSVKKGTCGTPGQLQGAGDPSTILGTLYRNTPQGVFGTCTAPLRGEPLPTADYGEITTGPATIRATVTDGSPREYSVEILKIYPEDRDNCRNFLLRVTDPDLLETTGGIVQGMSGSPILQNGKLVGAVTHVLVNDPTRGYGIFIENMLDAAA